MLKNLEFDIKKYAEKAREAVSEGVVLLKNEGEVLPLKEGSKLALFGRNQFSYYKSGTGSGGLVNTRYVVSIRDAICNSDKYVINTNLDNIYQEWLKDNPFDAGKGWAQEPWFQEEMPLDKGIVEAAGKESDTAIIFIGRTAGEDKDNAAEAGSYLLTEDENNMLSLVCSEFERTIVLLNVGNIIDMKWVDKYNPAAVLYVWQGGQEGGNGVLDVLDGTVSPSGKLADTIALDITDYPSTINYGDPKRNIYEEDIYVGYRYFETFAKDKVKYPFGFGLSYTTFDISVVSFDEEENGILVRAKVVNTGGRSGKEVVQLYVEAPEGKLGKAKRVLVAFEKTENLNPGEGQEIELFASWDKMASYDDTGVTDHKSAWVLEAGNYLFHIGNDVRNTIWAGTYNMSQLKVLEQLEEAMTPNISFKRMKSCGNGLEYEEVKKAEYKAQDRRKDRLPKEINYSGNKGYKLVDVDDDKISIEDFVAQLSDNDLFCIVRGEGMNSPRVTPGTGGAYGGVTDELIEDFGIPTACCSDGPSGIRMDCGNIAFALPNGACLASSFNVDLIEELYVYEGLELRKDHIDALLGPGINIHRNPLNGRNFEYFSEDPYLTGVMTVAQLHGMQSVGVSGVIKHFACNNQEFKRHDAEAVVSERALREIYLKGFEIAVKEGNANLIMSTYGPVNGFWTSSNYDLLTTILRNQWGFNGVVMTDWWAKCNDEGCDGDRANTAAMIRAQNDLYMCNKNPGANSNNDNLEEALKSGKIERSELQRAAVNICKYLITTPSFLRFAGRETELDKRLAEVVDETDNMVLDPIDVELDSDTVVDGKVFDTGKGSNVLLNIMPSKVGKFEFEFICRASAESEEVAQISCTVFLNRDVLTTVDLIGNEKEWKTVRFETANNSFDQSFFLRFYFGQSGMEIKEINITYREIVN
ncbi:MAG: glycoside hydrolase family 3 C-terminal domain-containing protein [Butyrivibrio sp.]|nr:glycoside hydrolase family 3 C-terminal domain-containing protein [Butyrivibrio sp.]